MHVPDLGSSVQEAVHDAAQTVKPRLRGPAARGHFPAVAGRWHRPDQPGAGAAQRGRGLRRVSTRSPLACCSGERALPPRHLVAARRGVLRRLDHANIFLIIAGTYTPLALSCCSTRTERSCCSCLVWAGRVRRRRVPGACGSARRAGCTRRSTSPWAGRRSFYLPRLPADQRPARARPDLAGGLLYTAGRASSTPSSAPNPSPALVRLPRGLPRAHRRRLHRALRRRVADRVLLVLGGRRPLPTIPVAAVELPPDVRPSWRRRPSPARTGPWCPRPAGP